LTRRNGKDGSVSTLWGFSNYNIRGLEGDHFREKAPERKYRERENSSAEGKETGKRSHQKPQRDNRTDLTPRRPTSTGKAGLQNTQHRGGITKERVGRHIEGEEEPGTRWAGGAEGKELRKRSYKGMLRQKGGDCLLSAVGVQGGHEHRRAKVTGVVVHIL